MADGIRKMHEHQEMKGYGGYEYVVRGAEVSCSYGSKTCVLNLPNDHGIVLADGRPMIITSDCTAQNIRGFGMCYKNRRNPCKCNHELSEWSVERKQTMQIEDSITKKMKYAVTKDSTTICKIGGVVSFKTSGQTSPSYENINVKGAVEIVEDVKGSWKRGTDGNDFLGHVKVKNSGAYKFGIGLYYDKTCGTPGDVFIYESKMGKLECIGEYMIQKHVKKEEKFRENMLEIGENNYKYVQSQYYWYYWINVILFADTDYYFEVDCPGENTFDYKLIGNQEKEKLDSNYTAGVWILNPGLKISNPDVYGYLRLSNYLYKNNKGNEVVIMYLAPEYNWLVRDFMSVRVAQGKSIASDGSNFLSAVSLSFTGLTYIKVIPDAVKAIMGNASAALSGIALIIALLPKPLLERVKEKMYQNPNDCLKITLYDVSDGTSINGDSNITSYKVEICSEYSENISMEICGEKYLPGEFHMLKTQGISFQKMQTIRDNIEEIFNNIDKNF